MTIKFNTLSNQQISPSFTKTSGPDGIVAQYELGLQDLNLALSSAEVGLQDFQAAVETMDLPMIGEYSEFLKNALGLVSEFSEEVNNIQQNNQEAIDAWQILKGNTLYLDDLYTQISDLEEQKNVVLNSNLPQSDKNAQIASLQDQIDSIYSYDVNAAQGYVASAQADLYNIAPNALDIYSDH